jgi:hypothetical protein
MGSRYRALAEIGAADGRIAGEGRRPAAHDDMAGP